MSPSLTERLRARFGGAGVLAARLSVFTAAPVLSMLASLVLMPVISRVVGPAGWASILSAITIGTGAATLILWNWNVMGPAAIAIAGDDDARRELYGRSVRMRLLTTAIVSPGAAAMTWFVSADGFRLVAACLTVVTAAATGMSPSWYAIGSGRPRLMVNYEVAPKLLAAAIGAGLMLLTRSVWPYVVVLAVISAAGLARGHLTIMEGHQLRRGGIGDIVKDITSNTTTAAIGVSVMLYASAPVPTASYYLPHESASRLGSGDAAYRVGLIAVMALGNTLQGWTLSHSGDPLRRQRLAFLSQVGLAAVGAVALGLLTPWVTGIFFGGDLAAQPAVAWAYGAAFFSLCSSTPLVRNILMPVNPAAILRATLVSLVVGMALMIWAGRAGLPAMIVGGMAIGEAVLLLLLLAPAWRALPHVHAVVAAARPADPDPPASEGSAP